jgi:ankyrin repeat protein
LTASSHSVVSQSSDDAIVRRLLADCTTSSGNTRDCETALIFAATMGSVEPVEALLDRGADINANWKRSIE